jgi:gamma-glutamylcyclotransferase (GGCT)/AIG2-like uncharacterized protein YtfP
VDALKVFVYGTLKPGESNYQSYCAGKVSEVTRVYTFGQLYHLGACGYPAMTLGRSKVGGFLLTFLDLSVLEKLDELESYQLQRAPAENEYQRQKIIVYEPSGKPLGEAWGYLMSFEKVQQFGGILVPSGWWTG